MASTTPGTQSPRRVLVVATVHWTTTTRLCLAMAEAGLATTAVVPDHHALRGMPGIQCRRLGGTRRQALKSISALIRETCPHQIIPADERAIDLLRILHERSVAGDAGDGKRTAQLIEDALGTPHSFALPCQKSWLIDQARQEGIAVPATEIVADMHALRQLLARRRFPMVLKLDRSFSGHGVCIVRDEREAEQAFRKLRTMAGSIGAIIQSVRRRNIGGLEGVHEKPPAITLQAFVDGAPANRAVACHRGKVLAGLSVEAVCTSAANGPATVVRIIESPGMSEAAEKLMRRLNFSGFAGLDFVIDKESGQPLLIELNTRPTQICHIAVDASSDMIGRLAIALGAPAPPRRLPNVGGSTIALFPQESWRNPDSKYLRSAYHDVPWSMPEFIAAYGTPPAPRRLRQWVKAMVRRAGTDIPAELQGTALAAVPQNLTRPPSSI